jgi:hypothetical protein
MTRRILTSKLRDRKGICRLPTANLSGSANHLAPGRQNGTLWIGKDQDNWLRSDDLVAIVGRLPAFPSTGSSNLDRLRRGLCHAPLRLPFPDIVIIVGCALEIASFVEPSRC